MRGTVVGLLADGRLVAVAGFGAARFVARYRALLLDGADGAAALELAQHAQRPLRPRAATQPRARAARRQRKSLRSTASAMTTPSAMRPYLILGSASRCCRLARAWSTNRFGLARSLSTSRLSASASLAFSISLLDGVRVARHDAS